MNACFKTNISGKSQSDGAQSVDVRNSITGTPKPRRHWQIQIEPSSTPSTGTMSIAIRTPGAKRYSTLTTTINLTGTELTVSFDALADSIRLTPTNFDSNKTYSAYLAAV